MYCSKTGLTKFNRFETLYVILLRPEKKKVLYIHSLALALTLTPSLTLALAFNLLPLQPTAMLFSLVYLTCGSATEHKYSIRCVKDYK